MMMMLMLMQAIMMEFEKFRHQSKRQGVEAHPKVIQATFHRTISSPNIQESMASFINSTSVQMKAEARQHSRLDESADEEHYATSDLTIQMRVDELFVDFGVRPARSIPYEIPEEHSMRSRLSTEKGAATDQHLDSVIQLKLELAQKQATLDELSSKYNALLVQKRAHQLDMMAENSRLGRENEWLRAQLRQGTATALPTAHQLLKLKSSPLCNLADTQDRLTPPCPSQPSYTFNIH
jgi:hypothetical protein